MKLDERYILHILDAISKIETYINNMDEKTFKTNELVQDGVLRRIQIIGEAVKQISGELKLRHPEVSWTDIAGMRDKVTHNYLGVDLNAVWKTVTIDIPALKSQAQSILKELSNSGKKGQSN